LEAGGGSGATTRVGSALVAVAVAVSAGAGAGAVAPLVVAVAAPPLLGGSAAGWPERSRSAITTATPDAPAMPVPFSHAGFAGPADAALVAASIARSRAAALGVSVSAERRSSLAKSSGLSSSRRFTGDLLCRRVAL